jgi:hypothetical protein
VENFARIVGEYYFSLQAEGEDPAKHRIVTLQYQPLEEGRPQGHFTVLAEWEWGEKEAIRTVLETGVLDRSAGFTPVGFDLQRKLAFLAERARRHGLFRGGAEPTEQHLVPERSVDLAEAADSPPPEIEHLRAMDMEISTLYGRQQFQGIVDHLERERQMVLHLYQRIRNGP